MIILRTRHHNRDGSRTPREYHSGILSQTAGDVLLIIFDVNSHIIKWNVKRKIKA